MRLWQLIPQHPNRSLLGDNISTVTLRNMAQGKSMHDGLMSPYNLLCLSSLDHGMAGRGMSVEWLDKNCYVARPALT